MTQNVGTLPFSLVLSSCLSQAHHNSIVVWMKLPICNQLNLFSFFLTLERNTRNVCYLLCVDMVWEKVPISNIIYRRSRHKWQKNILERDTWAKLRKIKVVNHAEYCNRDISASAKQWSLFRSIMWMYWLKNFNVKEKKIILVSQKKNSNLNNFVSFLPCYFISFASLENL